MGNSWISLLPYQTIDIVSEYYYKRHQRELNSYDSRSIISHFRQARAFHDNVKHSDLSVKPLLQYYCINSLSKGMIYLLDCTKKEESLCPSHGLKISNWNECIKTKNFGDMQFKIQDGAFKSLIDATNNCNYIWHNSDSVNHSEIMPKPSDDSDFLLSDILKTIPNLHDEYYLWFKEDPIYVFINEMNPIGYEFKIEPYYANADTNEGVEPYLHEHYEILKVNGSTTFKPKLLTYRPVFQYWNWGSTNCGRACIVPHICTKFSLNMISSMFALSFFMGMLSRYYPTTWISILHGGKGDKCFPYLYSAIEYIEEYFPICVLDFLNSPYLFEEIDH